MIAEDIQAYSSLLRRLLFTCDRHFEGGRSYFESYNRTTTRVIVIRQFRKISDYISLAMPVGYKK
jgi:hypothetical protein